MSLFRLPLPDYPWDAMVPFAVRAREHEDGVVDLSIGSPVDKTPEIVRSALAGAAEAHAYPTTQGSERLRAAIVQWFARRRGVDALTFANVVPTIGSKEMVALLPFFLGVGAGDVIVHPRAAYPTYAMGGFLTGATTVASDDPREWPNNTRLVWVNSPGNPDGRVLDVEDLRLRVEWARERGAVIVGDECYAELGWEEPWKTQRIPSILDPRVVGSQYDGVLALYSLSKQSNMAGYRAAFAAGSAELIASILTIRKHAGLIVPAPLQEAMTVALNDNAHVDAQRELYRERRNILKPALESAGFRIDHSEAGLYLWATEGREVWETVQRFAEIGVLVGPGVFYGDFPEHVRLSLTAPTERIRAAVRRLAAF